jgi:hypothetical protein
MDGGRVYRVMGVWLFYWVLLWLQLPLRTGSAAGLLAGECLRSLMTPRRISHWFSAC